MIDPHVEHGGASSWFCIAANDEVGLLAITAVDDAQMELMEEVEERRALRGLKHLEQERVIGHAVLEPLRVGLFYKHPRLSPAGLQLVSDLVASLELALLGGHEVA